MHIHVTVAILYMCSRSISWSLFHVLSAEFSWNICFIVTKYATKDKIKVKVTLLVSIQITIYSLANKILRKGYLTYYLELLVLENRGLQVNNLGQTVGIETYWCLLGKLVEGNYLCYYVLCTRRHLCCSNIFCFSNHWWYYNLGLFIDWNCFSPEGCDSRDSILLRQTHGCCYMCIHRICGTTRLVKLNCAISKHSLIKRTCLFTCRTNRFFFILAVLTVR